MGCEMTFENVLMSYNKFVFRIAYTYTKNYAEAEDILQDVFIKYFKHNEPFECEEKLRGWLIKVTVNMSKNYLRSFRFKKNDEIDENMPEPIQNPNKFEDKTDVYQAVMKLPAKYRQVVMLFYYEDMTINQIADAFDCKESTVKTQLFRARDMLKETLKGEYDYEI